MMKAIPVLYSHKENCCGCAACYAICPKHAIVMEADENGFDYPLINGERCIRCSKCLNICPMKRN